MPKYFPNQIEPKWSQRWKEDKRYQPDLNGAKKPYYNLMMFPYPSAEGLHVGNMYAFTGSDVWGRYQRMQGKDVFEPIGLDGFGIHSENYAMKVGSNPLDLSKVTESRFYDQLTMIGNSYAWDFTVETYKPEFYKWTQWLFLQMYKAGLAYRNKAEVNWCPSCKTVLADEQVISGECERCSSTVEKKELEQWFFRITKYADRLLNNLESIDWSEKVKTIQKNWIGKSEGALIKFAIDKSTSEESPSSQKSASSTFLEVFTTRPDTIYGATFVVINPQHQLLKEIVSSEKQQEVEDYIQKAKLKSQTAGAEKDLEKTGVFTGGYVINPLNSEKIPVWVADYVLSSYGTGAIMAVPAHDFRDFDFAKKYNLEIKTVIQPTGQGEAGSGGEDSKSSLELVYEGNGVLVNSDHYSGLDSTEAKKKIISFLEGNLLGKAESHYHLRDWLISRQRYWGPPIPIIYCSKCGTVPVPEKDLPVMLPMMEDFRPTGTGLGPLASNEEFMNTPCPKCGSLAKRETDVSDTFLDSAWYFLRYPSSDIETAPFDIDRTKRWLPVDMYIGGAEHAVLHLMYSRFVTMVLHDLGFLDFEEPFIKFRAHGLIILNGAKMSKSKGNVVNPDDYIKEYGADTLRTYLMFMGPLADGGDFRSLAVSGVYRFLSRVWDLVHQANFGEVTKEEQRALHKTIKRASEGIEDLHYNVSIAALMEFLNFIVKQKTVSKETLQTFLKMLAPFAPFITEELWEVLGETYSIHQQAWPQLEEKYLETEEVTVVVSVNGKARDQLMIQKDVLSKEKDIEELALKSPKVQKFLDGKQIVKTIYVPGKIINIVVK